MAGSIIREATIVVGVQQGKVDLRVPELVKLVKIQKEEKLALDKVTKGLKEAEKAQDKVSAGVNVAIGLTKKYAVVQAVLTAKRILDTAATISDTAAQIANTVAKVAATVAARALAIALNPVTLAIGAAMAVGAALAATWRFFTDDTKAAAAAQIELANAIKKVRQELERTQALAGKLQGIRGLAFDKGAANKAKAGKRQENKADLVGQLSELKRNQELATATANISGDVSPAELERINQFQKSRLDIRKKLQALEEEHIGSEKERVNLAKQANEEKKQEIRLQNAALAKANQEVKAANDKVKATQANVKALKAASVSSKQRLGDATPAEIARLESIKARQEQGQEIGLEDQGFVRQFFDKFQKEETDKRASERFDRFEQGFGGSTAEDALREGRRKGGAALAEERQAKKDRDKLTDPGVTDEDLAEIIKDKNKKLEVEFDAFLQQMLDIIEKQGEQINKISESIDKADAAIQASANN